MQSMTEWVFGRAWVVLVCIVLSTVLIYSVLGSAAAESVTAQLSISAGSVTGNLNAAATITPYIERFDATPDETSCNPGTPPSTFWVRLPAATGAIVYNATTDWIWISTAALANGITNSFNAHGGGFTAGTCDEGGYSWSASNLNMTFAFKITNADGTGVGLIVGFGDLPGSGGSAGGTDWTGPVARFVYNSVNDSAAFAVCIFNNTFSCSASIWGLNNQQWYTVTLRYWSSNTTAFANIPSIGSRSLIGTWANEVDVASVILGARGGGGASEAISGAVDNITVPQGRRGHWTSALQGSQNVQRMDLTYALGLDVSGSGSSLGPFYANYSSGVNLWIRSTSISSGSSFTLDQSAGTGGSFSAIVPQWSLTIRLVHDDGLEAQLTQLLSVSVTYETEEGPGTGLPLKWITPPISLSFVRVICDPALFELQCRAELLANATGVSIVQSLWYVDGRFIAEGWPPGTRDPAPISSRVHVADLSVFAFPIRIANVTVELQLTNGQGLVIWGAEIVDNSWLLIPIGIVIAGILLRQLWRVSKARREGA